MIEHRNVRDHHPLLALSSKMTRRKHIVMEVQMQTKVQKEILTDSSSFFPQQKYLFPVKNRKHFSLGVFVE